MAKRKKDERAEPITEGVEPCPFCKSDRTYVGVASGTEIAGQCYDCRARGPKFTYGMVDDGEVKVEKWDDLNDLDKQLQQMALKAWNKCGEK